ncbi:hypothetical protein [Actinoplanes subglobosus]|uniref:GAF domain-containing protein n=1 Tax=Actinoplanes subglobosus TaxID=1547892 RepID=A0ABV8J9G2_9ACTN
MPQSIAGRVLAQVVREGFRAHDAVIHPFGAGAPDGPGDTGGLLVTGVPLRIDGYPAGILCLHHERPLSPGLHWLLAEVAVQMGHLLSDHALADDRFYELMALASRAAVATEE